MIYLLHITEVSYWHSTIYHEITTFCPAFSSCFMLLSRKLADSLSFPLILPLFSAGVHMFCSLCFPSHSVFLYVSLALVPAASHTLPLVLPFCLPAFLFTIPSFVRLFCRFCVFGGQVTPACWLSATQNVLMYLRFPCFSSALSPFSSSIPHRLFSVTCSSFLLPSHPCMQIPHSHHHSPFLHYFPLPFTTFSFSACSPLPHFAPWLPLVAPSFPPQCFLSPVLS